MQEGFHVVQLIRRDPLTLFEWSALHRKWDQFEEKHEFGPLARHVIIEVIPCLNPEDGVFVMVYASEAFMDRTGIPPSWSDKYPFEG